MYVIEFTALMFNLRNDIRNERRNVDSVGCHFVTGSDKKINSMT